MTPAEPLISFAAFTSQLDARTIGGSASVDRSAKVAASDVAADAAEEPVVDRMRERALEMGIEMGAAPRAARGSSPDLRR
jgi:hypothetical protein